MILNDEGLRCVAVDIRQTILRSLRCRELKQLVIVLFFYFVFENS